MILVLGQLGEHKVYPIHCINYRRVIRIDSLFILVEENYHWSAGDENVKFNIIMVSKDKLKIQKLKDELTLEEIGDRVMSGQFNNGDIKAINQNILNNNLQDTYLQRINNEKARDITIGYNGPNYKYCGRGEDFFHINYEIYELLEDTFNDVGKFIEYLNK